MDQTVLESFAQLKAPESCRLISFDKAEVVTLESDPPQYVLTVSGTTPWGHMTVDLMPLIYIQRPEYWGIEVVGCMKGIGIPVMTPYEVSMNVTGFLGTKGIEVIGADRSEKIDVGESGEPVGRYELRIVKPDGEVLGSATLTCSPAGGSHPNAEKACAQLTDAEGDVEKIPPEDRICPRIFDPVVMVAEGTWKGTPRSFKREFPNKCEGIGGTGGILFDFEGPRR